MQGVQQETRRAIKLSPAMWPRRMFKAQWSLKLLRPVIQVKMQKYLVEPVPPLARDVPTMAPPAEQTPVDEHAAVQESLVDEIIKILFGWGLLAHWC